MPKHGASGSMHEKMAEKTRIIANRYKIGQKLGSGSFGTVFLVEDLKCIAKKKVLKQIPLGSLQADETIGAVDEARLLAKLDHPGITKFHDSFIDGEFFCIITEYCEGGDLNRKIQSWKKCGKRIEEMVIVTWFIQLLLAVQYMHQRRVLHRDLKTRNIFLKKNMIKIGDFGISRILMGTTDMATTFTGTPYFMAPEILKHEGYNSKSDIWSLGVVLHELCSLERAFDGSNLMGVMFKIVEGDAPKLPDCYSSDLSAIHRSMLCKDPEKRPSACDILKLPFILQHLQKLRMKISGGLTVDRCKAEQEAWEIAKILAQRKEIGSIDHAPAIVDSSESRPLTARQRLAMRKKDMADKDAELLRRLTTSSYEENRRKCSDLKERQLKVHSELPLTRPFENDRNIVNPSTACRPLRNPSEETFESKAEHLPNSDYFEKVSYSIDERSYGMIRKGVCIDEDSDESDTGESILRFQNLREHGARYGEVPEDGVFAERYYSQYDDFESSGDSDDDIDLDSMSEEYGALVERMQDAFNLTSDLTSTLAEDLDKLSVSRNSMRLEKIAALKAECAKVLGEASFQRVYQYLNKVRFEDDRSISEEAIMRGLRRIVPNTRDCFLVDQLLFLEKQCQIAADYL